MAKVKIEAAGKHILLEIPPAKRGFDSFFAFGVHKSGSTLLHNLLRSACQAAGIPSIDIPTSYFNSSVLVDVKENAIASLPFLYPEGYAYLGARTYWCKDIGFDLSKNKKVLLVRDPRDAVISYFFSDTYSHPIPEGNEKWEKQRHFLQKLSDPNDAGDYINQKIGWLNKVYNDYEKLLGAERMRVYRYEDVIFYKREWLTDLCDYFSIPLDLNTIYRIADQHDMLPEKEEKSSHVRQVVPGNYKKHFSKEVIGQLNKKFSRVLSRFGYDKVHSYHVE